MLTGQTLQRDGKGFDGIQAIRFLAAMLVVVMHAIESMVSRGAGIAMWNGGGIGVDMFFVVSGFVMALTTANIPHGWPARLHASLLFCKRRLIRLLPVYWFYTTLKIILVLFLPALALRATLDPSHILASFLLFPAVAPWGLVQPILPVGWTLCLEMLFYAIFALAILLGAPRLIFCLLVFGLISLLHRWMPHVVALAFYQHIMVYDFALGIFIAWAWKKSGRVPRLFALVAMVPAFCGIFGGTFGSGVWFYLARGMAAGAFVWSIAVLEPVWQGLRFLPFVKHLGDASYSTYLSHSFVAPFTVIALVNYLPPAITLVAVVSSCALAGSLSYIFIERPMLNFFRTNLGADTARPATS